jgi:hypothetical protein
MPSSLEDLDLTVTNLDCFKEDIRLFFKPRFRKPGLVLPNIEDDNEESEK